MLIIDADRMIARPFPFQHLQSVGWWNSKVSQIRCGIQHIKLPDCHSPNRLWNSSGGLRIEAIIDVFGCLVREVQDHGL